MTHSLVLFFCFIVGATVLASAILRHTNAILVRITVVITDIIPDDPTEACSTCARVYTSPGLTAPHMARHTHNTAPYRPARSLLDAGCTRQWYRRPTGPGDLPRAPSTFDACGTCTRVYTSPGPTAARMARHTPNTAPCRPPRSPFDVGCTVAPVARETSPAPYRARWSGVLVGR